MTTLIDRLRDRSEHFAFRGGDECALLLAARLEQADRLREALREVYEVWAGSEGFVPQTAPEGYQQRLIEQMRDIARAALGQREGGNG